MKIVVTGTAGFIGAQTALRLLERGDEVIGIDSVDDYYDPALKRARLKRLSKLDKFTFDHFNLSDGKKTAEAFRKAGAHGVIHLAAQPGVRYSLKNPQAYVDSNIQAFVNVLEACRHCRVEHLVYASSSSVYGANTVLPYSPDQTTDHPISLYGATKKANEVMAHSYSHLFKIPATGLRFFTVYGPWGRPDMALFLFTRKILAGESIDVYNFGKHRRDFTFIDDIVEGVVRVLDRAPQATPEGPPHRIYNIGNSDPVWLSDVIATLEKCLGKKAILNPMPLQTGDVMDTYADVEALVRDTGFRPNTRLEVGVGKFVDWYRTYYHV